jgi:DNA-binding GntR family transcriptional regulator
MKKLLPHTNSDRGLSNWVVSSLRESILNGHFEPGEKLDQDKIAAEFNVSRTPIREALKVLASEGFVEIQSYHGAFIPRFSRQDVQDVYEVRSVIEYELVRLAVPLIPDEVLEHLKEILDQDAEAFQTGVDRKHLESDWEFHNTVANYCQNKILKEILDNLNNRIIRVLSFALHQPGTHLHISHNEHMEILEAMRIRNANKAAQLMQAHLQNSAERIESFIVE